MFNLPISNGYENKKYNAVKILLFSLSLPNIYYNKIAKYWNNVHLKYCAL